MFIDYYVRRLRQLSQEMYKKVTYIRMRKFIIHERKFLFIPIKVQFITISNAIPYTSGINSTSSSLKKKKVGAFREGKEKEKERLKKRGRESVKKKDKEKEKEEEEEDEKMETAVLKVHRCP